MATKTKEPVIRLNRDIRNHIVTKLTAPIKEELYKLDKYDYFNGYAEKLLNAYLGKDKRRFNAAPQEWFEKVNAIRVRDDAGNRVMLKFKDGATAVPRRMSHSFNAAFYVGESNNSTRSPALEALCEELRAKMKHSTDERKRLFALSRNIHDAIEQYKTVGQLKKDWPEAYAALPDYFVKPQTTTIAHNVGDLRAQLAALNKGDK